MDKWSAFDRPSQVHFYFCGTSGHNRLHIITSDIAILRNVDTRSSSSKTGGWTPDQLRDWIEAVRSRKDAGCLCLLILTSKWRTLANSLLHTEADNHLQDHVNNSQIAQNGFAKKRGLTDIQVGGVHQPVAGPAHDLVLGDVHRQVRVVRHDDGDLQCERVHQSAHDLRG